MAGSPASPRAPPAGAADASRDAEVAGETGAAYPRFETFQPAGADWSLKDFAWDSTRSVAVSREHLSRSAGGKRVAEDEAGAPIDPGWLPGKARDAKAGDPLLGVAPARALALEHPPVDAAAPDGEQLSGGSGGSGSDNAGGRSDVGSRGEGARSGQRASSRARLAAVGAPVGPRRCLSDGCAASCVPGSKKRIERLLCAEHAKDADVRVSGVSSRFCQVCYVLHDQRAFNGKDKTCREILARKKSARKRKATETAARKQRVVDHRASRAARLRGDFGVASAAALTLGLAAKKTPLPPAAPTALEQAWSWFAGPSPADSPAPSDSSRRMLSAMEDGSLASRVASSVAVRVPGANPAMLNHLRGGAVGLTDAGGVLGPRDVGGFARGGSWFSPHHAASQSYLAANAEALTAVEERMLQAYLAAPSAAEGSAEVRPERSADPGFDAFIRPGSLIFGAHAPGALASADAGYVLERIANGPGAESALVRRAMERHPVVAAEEGPEEADGSPEGSPEGSSACPAALDASGDRLLFLPEGVFGSFNGTICRLVRDPRTGAPSTVPVTGLPEGFPEGLLGAAESVVDTSAPVARVRLPWAPKAATTRLVCMFQGSHVPTRVLKSRPGELLLELSFQPEGGAEAAEAWRRERRGGRLSPKSVGSAAEDSRDDDDDDSPDGSARERALRASLDESSLDSPRGDAEDHRHHAPLEGTATLEVVIAEGPMRGLPVGRAIPLLFTPDVALAAEVTAALDALEQTIDARESGRLCESDPRAYDRGEDLADDQVPGVVLPDPVALLSMLGTVLAAFDRGFEPQPRMLRGAVAMARYFNLERTAARLDVDLRPETSAKRVAREIARAGAGALAATARAVTRARIALLAVALAAAWSRLAALLAGPLEGLEGTHPPGAEGRTVATLPRAFRTPQTALVALVACALARFVFVDASRRERRDERERAAASSESSARSAVAAQNVGFAVGPAVATAVVCEHLRMIEHGAGDPSRAMSLPYLAFVFACETVPAVAFVALCCVAGDGWRRARWPAVSALTHATRALACLVRVHHEYDTRGELMVGQAANVASALMMMGFFPVPTALDAGGLCALLVTCDWIGHVAETGAVPPSLARRAGTLPAEDVALTLALEVAFRVLAPVALNAALARARAEWIPTVARRGR